MIFDLCQFWLRVIDFCCWDVDCPFCELLSLCIYRQSTRYFAPRYLGIFVKFLPLLHSQLELSNLGVIFTCQLELSWWIIPLDFTFRPFLPIFLESLCPFQLYGWVHVGFWDSGKGIPFPVCLSGHQQWWLIPWVFRNKQEVGWAFVWVKAGCVKLNYQRW